MSPATLTIRHTVCTHIDWQTRDHRQNLGAFCCRLQSKRNVRKTSGHDPLRHTEKHVPEIKNRPRAGVLTPRCEAVAHLSAQVCHTRQWLLNDFFEQCKGEPTFGSDVSSSCRRKRVKAAVKEELLLSEFQDES